MSLIVDTKKITEAFAAAGVANRAARRADVYNMVRAGNVAGAIGTLMAGSCVDEIRAARAAFNKKLAE